MYLTLTPIEDVLRTGRAEQSPLAARFIAAARQTFGICVEACYLQASTHLLLPPGQSIAGLRRGKPQFVEEDILSFYLHAGRSGSAAVDDALQEELFALFTGLLADSGEQPAYPRLYLPEEMAEYGWNNTPRDRWDMSRVIPCTGSAEKRHAVTVEYIDRLALWHVLSRSLPALNQLASVRGIGGKVCCGWDAARGGMACYVIVSPYTLYETNLCRFPAKFAAEACQHLAPRDKWDVITPAALTPIVTTWEALTPDQRFALSRE